MKGIFQSVIYIVGAALIVTCMPSQNDQVNICDIKPEYRYECGWFGIDQGTCEKKGCCWDSTHPDALFCYNSKLGPPPTCDVQSKNRYECGWLGIDKQTCLKRGCCWDESDPNAKYCYVKGNSHLPDGLCPVAPSERVECGYYGITKEECLNRACCWDETVTTPGARWCFKQPIDNPPLGCYVYHGIGGTCKYVCDQNERKIYGMSQCKGRICCV
ncbi:unnamed protein product [Porites lobata]|uniref:P-type domain-containing protein n=1 Tax=Porites lobata TaxID=104759 RepID=A0ABN8RFU5_9CNID|nr:unnamed protein product [Porites lobata]